jgi:hypothetical protein
MCSQRNLVKTDVETSMMKMFVMKRAEGVPEK